MDASEAPAVDVHVEVRTTRFADDLTALTGQLGFRVDAIYPADSPSTAIVSAHGVRLCLRASEYDQPAHLRLITDDSNVHEAALPGGTTLRVHPRTTGYVLPPNRPRVVIDRYLGNLGPAGRAGMRYRDLIPDRWGGRFISSHITITDGGPVPDYVHFHKIRFQMIFVKAGWVRLVYEDQGEPFVMERGDCVLQPPEIRHRVLESSPGLQVIEITSPAEHETIADWSLPLPNGVVDPNRTWDGQRFVRHTAAGADYQPWRIDGWEYRDTGIGAATGGLAGVRVARPTIGAAGSSTDDTEFCQLVVLRGSVAVTVDGERPAMLTDGDAVAIPGGVPYRLGDASLDCELLDVTLPDLAGRR